MGPLEAAGRGAIERLDGRGATEPPAEGGADSAAFAPVPRPLRELVVAVSWHFLFVLVVLFTIASLGVAVAAVLGAQR